MFKRLALIVVLWSVLNISSSIPPSHAQDSSNPYIQYFSHSRNAFIIERADGTDSRVLGEGLMTLTGDAHSIYVDGPGWSPSGQWFAWTSTQRSGYGGVVHYPIRKPHVLSVDGTRRLTLLDDIENAQLAWANDRDVLFVVTRQYTRIPRAELATILAVDFGYDSETIELLMQADQANERQRESPMETVYVVDTQLSVINVPTGTTLGTFTDRSFDNYYQGLPSTIHTADRNHLVLKYQDICAFFDWDCHSRHRVIINAQGKITHELLTADEARWDTVSTADWAAYSTERSFRIENILTHETHQWTPIDQLQKIYWSPDGIHALLFTESQVWVLDCTAATLTLLGSSSEFNKPYYDYGKPIWSLNGGYALLLGVDKNFYVFDRAQSTLTVWPLGNADDQWSSVNEYWLDNTRVALIRNGEVHIYDLVSRSLEPLDTGFPDDARLRLSPADNRYVAYVHGGATIHDRTTHMDLSIRPAYESYGTFTFGDVIWNDTGEWLFIAESAVHAGAGPSEYLGIVRADGAFRRELSYSWKRTPLTMIWLPPQVDPAHLPPPINPPVVPQPYKTFHDTHWSFYADWSPNGRWLATGSGDFQGGDITVWDVDTGTVVHVFEDAGQNDRVVWPPADVFVPELAPDEAVNGCYARSPDG